jgi:hypothetical protein
MFLPPRFVVALTLDQYFNYLGIYACVIGAAVLLVISIALWPLTLIIGLFILASWLFSYLTRPRAVVTQIRPPHYWPLDGDPRPLNDNPWPAPSSATLHGEIIPPNRKPPPSTSIVTRQGRIITIDPGDRWLTSW